MRKIADWQDGNRSTVLYRTILCCLDVQFNFAVNFKSIFVTVLPRVQGGPKSKTLKIFQQYIDKQVTKLPSAMQCLTFLDHPA